MPILSRSRIWASYAYLSAVCALAISALVLACVRSGVPSFGLVVLVWGMHCLSESTQVYFRPGASSIGFVALMVGAFAGSAATACLIGLVSGVSLNEYRHRQPQLLAFNMAQGALYVLGGGVVYHGVLSFSSSTGGQLAAAVLGSLAAFLINSSLVVGATVLRRRMTVTQAAHRFLWLAPIYVVFGIAASVISYLFSKYSYAAIGFTILPLILVRVVYRSMSELNEGRLALLRAFVNTVEMKDQYLKGHSERVAALAGRIASALGDARLDPYSVYIGALLHDIGKAVVPTTILKKPDRLSDGEFETMRRHPDVGALVARQAVFLRDVVPQILHHHERMDGRGYPSCLIGEAIPLAARVTAVADTFDALTSDRSYRNALRETEALAEIQRVAGTQLDPRVVSALVAVLGGAGDRYENLSPHSDAVRI